MIIIIILIVLVVIIIIIIITIIIIIIVLLQFVYICQLGPEQNHGSEPPEECLSNLLD